MKFHFNHLHVNQKGLDWNEFQGMTEYLKSHGVEYDKCFYNEMGSLDTYYNLTEKADLNAVMAYNYSEHVLSLVFY